MVLEDTVQRLPCASYAFGRSWRYVALHFDLSTSQTCIGAGVAALSGRSWCRWFHGARGLARYSLFTRQRRVDRWRNSSLAGISGNAVERRGNGGSSALERFLFQCAKMMQRTQLRGWRPRCRYLLSRKGSRTGEDFVMPDLVEGWSFDIVAAWFPSWSQLFAWGLINIDRVVR